MHSRRLITHIGTISIIRKPPHQFTRKTGIVIALGFTLFLISCSKKIHDISPSYTRYSEGLYRIELELDSETASFIKDKQIYLTLSTFDCESGNRYFPAEAFVGTSKVNRFDFLVEREFTVFHADVPTAVFEVYSSPCLRLEGGGYGGYRIESSSIQIEPKV